MSEAYFETIELVNPKFDEDALYLSVYGLRIYKGSGISGGIEQDWYDRSNMVASQDTILITANYRVVPVHLSWRLSSREFILSTLGYDLKAQLVATLSASSTTPKLGLQMKEGTDHYSDHNGFPIPLQ